MQTNGGPRYLQRKVSYDNIATEHLAELSGLAAEKGGRLLEDLDQAFADCDRDTGLATDGTGRNRVTVGVYYWQQKCITDDDAAAGVSSGSGDGFSRDGKADA